MKKKIQRTNFIELENVFQALNGPKGCAWDKKQTQRSLIPQLQEEVREYIRAVNSNDPEAIKEELGDVLLHVMFSASIAQRYKMFDIEEVMRVLIEKLHRRHPHVFGDTQVAGTKEIIRNWKKIKAQEKKNKESKKGKRWQNKKR